MNNRYCEHCHPTKRTDHFNLHIEYYISKINKPISSIINFFDQLFSRTKGPSRDYFWSLVMDCLSLVKLIEFTDEPDESKLHNRSLIFFKEAKNRGLNIQAAKFFFGKYPNEFKLIYKGKRYYYEGIPLRIFKDRHFDMDDKNKIKKVLQKHNVPIAQGKLFTNTKKAFHFGKSIGFPLVVKPSSGSLSHHVTCSIKSEEELLNAIQIAKKYKPDFIIEKHIEGNLFRFTVVGRKHIFICRKDKANVVGDSHSTIEELIKIKNSHEFRGNSDQMNTTLHKIPIDDILIKNLSNQCFNLQSILPANKKIYIQDKFILAHGCDIINCAEDAHADNKELCLKIANILKTDLVGIDFICSDVNKSYKQQQTAILETNSLPYIDMHQHPSHGKPEPMARIVWDIVLDSLN